MTNKISDVILKAIIEHVIERLEEDNISISKIEFKKASALDSWFSGSYEIYQVDKDKTVFSIYIKHNKVIIGTLFAPEQPNYMVFLLNDPNSFDLIYDFVLELINLHSNQLNLEN